MLERNVFILHIKLISILYEYFLKFESSFISY